MEPVYRTIEIIAKAAVFATGTKVSYRGLENIPAAGGAVLAINHTSYVDFLPAALATVRAGRRLRFMVKAELQDVRIVSFMIKHTKAIPVDRSAGHGAYEAAVSSLKDGEIVAVYPEATISRSFELKEFKSGAARMAHEAEVPIVPLIVWGTQRIWTKDHLKDLGRSKIPVTVEVGRPLVAGPDFEQTTAELYDAMEQLLMRAQQQYPQEPGAYWVPRRLGGSAPTLEEAAVRDAAELEERARQKARKKTDGS
ncbi:1-acyl-sn-glycerol-3-phosphate acyltransferase [Mycobacterium sp. CBMA271]|uniref:lysophospholipid acyltransferase family protein n=1 Tax=unclassified Mycobacteroides TaxID=2618759 RepID=UPI0012DFE898|nr:MULTISPECIES: 1-acyl-sn-glycerol-3-phosphate acyltransferase [unclassified Mycobacteroides]MUM18019.1 acyltransferase [Mycobacteroides sp. CBMA 326]MUM23500.1 1-acyl-sn-glycerol-3-phosphate acyltransferase [Mycobacteroides sp. CBMA 271]